MSIYSYIVGIKKRQVITLGKTIHYHSVSIGYHIDNKDNSPNWANEELNKALWKFLADNAGQPIFVCMEHEMLEEYWEFQEIGGDSDKDISFVDYLSRGANSE